MVSWEKIDPKLIINYCNQTYSRYGEYPSIRDIFYRFVDKLWPNTKSVYKSLSKWLVDMRLNRKIDWRIIRDGSGREYEKGDWTHITPRQHTLLWLDLFTDIGSRYDLPKWLNQPNKVVVACEKEGDYPIIKAILYGLNVDTFYERGYSGWRPLFEAVEKINAEGKTPIIIAIGDFDPSGEDIVRFLTKAFTQLGLQNIQVEKVVITKEQIEKFKLPHKPEDAIEIQKLQRDPRFKCYSEDTRVLTKDGFKYFSELSYDDEVATLSADGFLEYQKPLEIQRYRYKGEMVEISGKFHNLLVTPNHRLLVKTTKKKMFFLKARELVQGVTDVYILALTMHKEGFSNRETAQKLGVPLSTAYAWINYGHRGKIPRYTLRLKRNAKWKGNDNNNVKDEWLSFLGWFISEGSAGKIGKRKDHRVQIAQSNTENVKEIASLTKSLGYNPHVDNNYGVIINNKALCLNLMQLGKAKDKYIPKELKGLPPRKLQKLLDTLIKGDGSVRTRSSMRYVTISKRLAEDVAEIALKCGYTVTFGCNGGLFRVGITKGRAYTTLRKNWPKKVDYNGYVYCVTVPNSVVFVERKGKTCWCGNSWPWGLFRVETAALRAKAPDFFDKTIKDAVMKHFDQEIWEKVEKAQEEARKKISEFFEDQQDLIDELRSNIRESDKLE
jgi:hypothetical protein